jgi:hypothetical protein
MKAATAGLSVPNSTERIIQEITALLPKKETVVAEMASV